MILKSKRAISKLMAKSGKYMLEMEIEQNFLNKYEHKPNQPYDAQTGQTGLNRNAS